MSRSCSDYTSSSILKQPHTFSFERALLCRLNMAGSTQTYSGVPCVVRYFLSIVKRKRVSQQIAIKFPKISYFTKIRPVGDKLRHANRQTNGQTRRSLLVIFADYANMPKILALSNMRHNRANFERFSYKEQVSIPEVHTTQSATAEDDTL